MSHEGARPRTGGGMAFLSSTGLAPPVAPGWRDDGKGHSLLLPHLFGVI